MPLELLAELEATCAEYGYSVQYSSFKGEKYIDSRFLKEEVSITIVKKDQREKK